ncbi:MAG: deoxyribonuclease V [Dehalococcoidales bacterium]
MVSSYDYNQGMQTISRHSWQVSTAEARALQMELAGEVSRVGNITTPRFIAGVDISVNKWHKTGTGAVVVLSYPGLKVAETQVVTDRIEFPYVPGLLSFREAPLILAAFERIKITPDIVLVDGQGIAHPRRLGIASHLGLLLGIPTIGCAKSRLCGEHEIPGAAAGSYAELTDNGEVIGAVLPTHANLKPLYISIGHMIDLPSAIKWVAACCRGYRLPEPARLAHLAAGGNLKAAVALR